ncbi:hypothetical protein [Thermoanaerobacterium thermosaccharolyticum]|uniref:hypothetical protein n=1 Tax=Thermoanaerobacterium thermosaccharolyticum TaxID=1517 RepID=UPI002FD91E65
MFKSEYELVNNAIPLIEKFFNYDNGHLEIIREPKGLFGVPDVLIYNGIIIAIEFKLKNWRKAIKQAYRYKSFSYESYVILDQDFISTAKKNISEFQRFNIGLCGIGKDYIVVYNKPKPKKPFDLDLRNKVYELLGIL